MVLLKLAVEERVSSFARNTENTFLGMLTDIVDIKYVTKSSNLN